MSCSNLIFREHESQINLCEKRLVEVRRKKDCMVRKEEREIHNLRYVGFVMYASLYQRLLENCWQCTNHPQESSSIWNLRTRFEEPYYVKKIVTFSILTQSNTQHLKYQTKFGISLNL